MPVGRLTLSAEHFDAAFPFHVAFDASGAVVSLGRVLSRICPELQQGRPVQEMLALERPSLPLTLESARSRAGALAILRLRTPEATLRGELLVDEARGLAVFLGSPWITSFEEAQVLGLTLSDFASHEAVGEFLLLFQTQQLALADAEALASRLRAQRGELRDANQRLAEQERRLRDQNDALERAARLKDEFLSSMSHELRTPLNAIIGMSESLIEGTYGDLAADQIGAVRLIESSGHHLLSLINDILDLSRIEANKLDLDVTEADVPGLCHAAASMVRSVAQRKGLSLRVSLDGAVDTVRADERRLKQILVNLLSNAVKFTPDGGLVRLVVTGDPAARTVAFSVIDSGIGIAPDDLGRLFQPFTQLDSSLARRHNGTGLGLVLSRRMAELHGGTVTAESTPGAGSTFTLTLPWEPVHAGTTGHDELVPAAAARARGGDGRRLLIIDDNPGNLRIVADYLRAKGFVVTLAGSAGEGLARARAERPALVLMDVQMPEVDGLEATRQFRADAALAEVPIVALTSLAMKGDRERCLAAGMNDYLSKPVKLHDLAALIDRHTQHIDAAA